MPRTTHTWVILLVVGLLVTGCTRSPEAQKVRHLSRGDRYAAREQYREALIEYRKALRYDRADARAIGQIGRMHYKLGELAQAYPHLLKAEGLAPGDLDLRLKLGTISLLAGKPEEARQAVHFVLEREPKNFDGLLLMASVAGRREEVDAAIRRLEAARPEWGAQVKFELALGALYLRKADLPSAERAFLAALARDPKSVEAHSALGTFYSSQGDAGRAEAEFKAAAHLAPVGSPAQMRLADFYLFLRRPEEAKRVLSEMTEKVPDNRLAWTRLAEIALREGQYDESLKAVQMVLKTDVSDLEGHFLLGRVCLAKRETDEAIREFQRVLEFEPRHAPARYQLGLAQLQAGNVQQAKADLREATLIAPNFVEAVLSLADLNIHTGAVQSAIEDLERFVARDPTAFAAQMLLGSGYLAGHEPAKAAVVFRKLSTLASEDPRGPFLVGEGLRAQGRTEEARTEFETALVRAPAYTEALSQLVSMAFAGKQPDVALSLVRKQIALAPKSGPLQHLLGVVHLTRREPKQAEAAFLKAIELEPHLIDAYVRLGNLYEAPGQYDEALATLSQRLTVDPKNVPAQMLVGMIYDRKGDIAKAQQAYERVLAANPWFAPAANNLAWIYSEHRGDEAKALELAQRAKAAAPVDPHVSDTLGWILYKRGVYQQAIGLLRESATKVPDDPVIQYHYGLASLKLGDKEVARKALTAAVNSPGNSGKKAEARRALRGIK